MRVLVALAGVCLLLVATPRIAAACSKRHQPVFELAELARDVAVVKVGAVPAARDAGNVTLRVTTTLKGATRRQLVARETNSSCHTGFRRGKTALVFLNADRWATGAYEGYVERPSPALLAAVTAWLAATTDAARVDVLMTVIGGADRRLRDDAAFYLGDAPALLAALTPAHAVTLIALRTGRADDPVLTVLARQRSTAWRTLLASTSPPTLQAHLRALLDHDLEAESSPAALAELIERTPGDSAPLRIAATERCERVHGKRLTAFSTYASGRSDHGWKLLATACRTGTPTPY